MLYPDELTGLKLVGTAGVEPARPKAPGPKPGVAAVTPRSQNGTRSGIRTRTSERTEDFKSPMATLTSPGPKCIELRLV